MKVASLMVPCRPDGSFTADLPDGADVLEWEHRGHFVYILYSYQPVPKPEWQV